MKNTIPLSQPIKFVPHEKSHFFGELKRRVDAYFEENNISKHANLEARMKMVILLAAYILPFVAMLYFHWDGLAGMVCYIIMSFSVAGIGMSVMHDANHGAFSKKQSVNNWVSYTINLLGGSAFNWKIQHNLLHHMYTNVPTHDHDIQERPALKFNPETKTKKVHRYQFLHAFFFYGLITLYWVTFKDLVQLISFTKQGLNKNSPKQNWILVAKITIMKILYFFVLIVMPIWLFGFSVSIVVGGFLLMHFIAGIVLTVIFQLAHTVEGTAHPMPNEKGVIANDWAIHQLNTTVNFSRGNPFLTWYLGGLNYQVEHHLFPKICHVHYPALSPIVKQTAQEYGISYLENETFAEAFRSHIRFLKKMGLPSWDEAIG